MPAAMLTFRDIEFRPVAGILFTDPLFGEAFFYDEHGNPPGRKDTPRPYYLCNYNGEIYHAIELRPTAHPKLLRKEVRELLKTSPGLWLRECAIVIEQLEYPTYDMSGKESQCQYDQKSITDTDPQTIDSLLSPDH